MESVTVFYILNTTLLLLHEIESAYEKEWEILKLPGEITGFLLMHVPIILIFFYGLTEIDERTALGLWMGVIFGTAGLLPFVVHKIAVRREGCFDKLISNILIYSNIVTGVITIVLSVRLIS